MYTVTYNVLELMSQASGGKVTTFKDLKIEWLWGSLLPLLSSPDNSFEANYFSSLSDKEV